MASAVDLCNMALANIGADGVVSSISPPDGSAEAGHCARFYPQARTELLESFAWPFAKTRVSLASVPNPSSIWAYAYAVPADCLNPVRVLNSFTLQYSGFWAAYGFVTPSEIALFNERGSADYETEGDVLLTNEPTAVLLYVRDVTDTSKFTPGFNTALGYLLSSFLAGPIIKGKEGASTGATLRQAAMQAAHAAMAIEANNSVEPAVQIPGSIRARA